MDVSSQATAVEQPLAPWVFFIISLVLLVLTQRWLQRHIIGLGMLATQKLDAAIKLYYVLMLPGVLIHELSHWLAAFLLFVKNIRFHIWPERDEQGIRLGYVEMEKPDPISGFIIGIAPIIVGMILVLLIAAKALDLPALADAVATADLAIIRPEVSRLRHTPYFYIWLYLIFVISNTMLPSPEDRRSWPAVIALLLVVALLLLASGLHEAIWNALGGHLTYALETFTAAFAPIIVINILAVALVWTIERVAGRLSGRSIDYRGPQTTSRAAVVQRPLSLQDIPLPVPAPPRNAPTIEPDEPHTPAPVFDDEEDESDYPPDYLDEAEYW